MIEEFGKQLEHYLNNDVELKRRLQGFKAFSGKPDGHYQRAREEGISAVARAVRCYPFGGKSQLPDGDLVSMRIADGGKTDQLVIHLEGDTFSVGHSSKGAPVLGIACAKDIFVKTVLGRHRWLWTMGMDDVELTYADDLPHSDWVTVLEILVTMQELVEFHPELWQLVESY